MTDIHSIHQDRKIPVINLCQGLSLSRATFYRRNEKNSITTIKKPPPNSISSEFKITILDIMHSERFTDCTPYQIYYTLLDEGKYIASIRTFYRLLKQQGETTPRRQQRHHRDVIKPELIATAPNQVWSWDITKLLSTQRLVYFHLYVLIDIYSRYVVGWLIADRECQFLARELIQKSTLKHGIQPSQLTVHSDNGPSMTSRTVAQLLEHLGVLKTHNRPYTSNDNPFSESQFKTLKYCPDFPQRFDSIKSAEKFCKHFFSWYNNQHYHSGIHWLNPRSAHNGDAEQILKNRHHVLVDAYHKNPIRFNKKMPTLKKLQPVFINPPENIGEKDLQKERIMT
jgi:putative transposase